MQILYFAWLRERMGRAEETLDLPADVDTVGTLLEWLRARDSQGAAAFVTPGVIRAAVNQVFATPGTPVASGDEVAFFPPVTGG